MKIHSLFFIWMSILIYLLFFFCIRITRNNIIDTTDESEGSHWSFFSPNLQLYLSTLKDPHIAPTTPTSISTIKAFESVSLILLHIFISIAIIT